ncbi:hypothetical protein B0J13DRAFT_503038 [Dactylonectria estremocensis]|uniref:Uncharacterized protein n=1 Tax=Dactylonectria estremocensis TaxID=1079267 RepID=A0A9P9ERU8_9HYPO|nr:hypothetical protein B0J13DRAFT_503038 [Dactylonectria estremocensis]
MASPSTVPLDSLLPEPHQPRPTATATTTTNPKCAHPQPKGGRVQRWWTEPRREAWADLRAAKWGRGALWFLLLLWTLTLVCVVITIPIISSLAVVDVSACRPDGSFSPYTGYSFWDFSGFFQITLPFGSLTFTQAKVIDIVWDLAVGRAGQSILAYYSWNAFSSYVRSSMATGPVTFDTFFTVYLEDEASLRSTAKMMRDFSTRRGLRSKLAMTFFIIAMIYVLAWPTLAGAMTGYTSANGAFVIDNQQNLISFSSFTPVAYVIHDGWRLNLTGNHLVSYIGSSSRDKEPIMMIGSTPDATACSAYPGLSDPCSLAQNVSEYVRRYGFLGLDANGAVNDIETQWIGTTLRPALNISAFYLDPLGPYFGNNWTDPRVNRQPYSNSSNMVFTIVDSNDTYPIGYIVEKGSCQALGAYQWGFSFLQLVIGVFLMFSWTMVVWLMWLKAHKELKQWNGIEVPGKYKAVLDLAAALNQELSSIGETPDALTNKQLRHRIKARLDEGRVKADIPFPIAKYSFRTNFWGWIKKEKWWLVLLLICGPMVVGPTAPIFIGVLAALAFGRTRKSRVFMIMCGLVIAIPPTVVVPLAG